MLNLNSEWSNTQKIQETEAGWVYGTNEKLVRDRRKSEEFYVKCQSRSAPIGVWNVNGQHLQVSWLYEICCVCKVFELLGLKIWTILEEQKVGVASLWNDTVLVSERKRGTSLLLPRQFKICYHIKICYAPPILSFISHYLHWWPKYCNICKYLLK